MKHYYVYYSYEEWGRGYIGKRECKCLPEEDVSYFGSYYDESFNPTNKIILQTFSSREEALDAEILLHSFFDVAKNPHFANKSRQTSTRFTSDGSGMRGKHHTPEARQKISLNSSSRRPEVREKLRIAHTGKLQSQETKDKKSIALRGEKNGMFGKTGSLNPFHGKTHSEEVKENLRKQRTGCKRSKESREKQATTMRGRTGVNKGRRWITDGTSNRLVPPDYPMPDGWQRGRTYEN
jgi:hypothetical protein